MTDDDVAAVALEIARSQHSQAVAALYAAERRLAVAIERTRAALAAALSWSDALEFGLRDRARREP